MGLEHAEEIACPRQQALEPGEHRKPPSVASLGGMRQFHDRLFAKRKGTERHPGRAALGDAARTIASAQRPETVAQVVDDRRRLLPRREVRAFRVLPIVKQAG